MEINDIQKLATLSRIEIGEEEQMGLLKELESILVYVDEIQEAVTEEQKSEAGEHRNIMREDENAHDSGLYTKEILEEAPETQDEYIKVKKILN
jgi:aspartyl/glutamyl-tRNA(Asn/Gln) amidotransferase C subunit